MSKDGELETVEERMEASKMERRDSDSANSDRFIFKDDDGEGILMTTDFSIKFEQKDGRSSLAAMRAGAPQGI